LQSTLFTPSYIHWYDYFAVILYISHFVVPMLVAFIFWLIDRQIFKEYTASFLLLSYLAFFTFIIFPAMPPWMASNNGYIPPLYKIMDQVMQSFAHPISVPTIYSFFGANLVAAFPSIHAAYPWLIFLFIYKKVPIIGYFSLVYVFGVWFSVVYLGEHYVVDVIAGFVYSSLAYQVIDHFGRKQLFLRVSTLK
jgi:membrane-associated phospholipid phosphatase